MDEGSLKLDDIFVDSILFKVLNYKSVKIDSLVMTLLELML